MKTRIEPLRERLYGTYASQHAGCGDGEAAALIYRRDIRPALPPPAAGPVLDIGCGQGQLVKLMLADGYDAAGIDVSPEQVALAQAAGLDQIQQGDYRALLELRAGQLAAVTATDVLEHLTKAEVLDTFDRIANALLPGGVFVARVPNAASPFGGRNPLWRLHARVFPYRTQCPPGRGDGGLCRGCRAALSARRAWLAERRAGGGVEVGERIVQGRARGGNGHVPGAYRDPEPDLRRA